MYFFVLSSINELSAVAVWCQNAHLRLSPTTVWALTGRVKSCLGILMVRLALVELPAQNWVIPLSGINCKLFEVLAR
jgi:hypothetical protein